MAKRALKHASHARPEDALRLWIQIVRFANGLQRDIDAKLRQSHGQSLSRFDVLSQLERAEDATLSVGQISKQLLTSAANITGLLDRMERDGLIRRSLSEADRRSFLVTATDEGLAVFRKMAVDNAGWVSEAFAHLDPEDFAVFSHLFEAALPASGDEKGEDVRPKATRRRAQAR